MATVPQSGGYEDSLAIATILTSLPLLYLFFINRHVFPLKQREPNLVLTIITAMVFWLAFRLFQMDHEEIVGAVVLVANFVCLGLVLCLFLLRVWKVFMDAGLTHERAQGKIGWFIIHRNLRSRKFHFWFAIGSSIIHVLLFVIVTLLDTDRALRPARETDNHQLGSWVLIGVATVYSLIFLAFSFRLAGLNDGFYIKQELRAVGIGTFAALLGFILQSTMDLPCTVTNCDVLILWCGAMWMLGGSLLFPLIVGFLRDPRFRFYAVPRCRPGKGDSSKTPSRADITPPDTEATTAFEPVAITKTMSQVRLQRLKKVPLRKFLTSPGGKEAFRAFTIREFSVENVMFVDAVQQLRDNANASKEEMRVLMDQYVRAGAPNQVNLPSIIIKKMEARFEEGGTVQDLKLLFDEADTHVMKLMERDAFRRFQLGAEWQQYVLEFDERPSLGSAEEAAPAQAPAQAAPAVVVVSSSSETVVTPVPVTPAVVTASVPVTPTAIVVTPPVTEVSSQPAEPDMGVSSHVDAPVSEGEAAPGDIV